MPKPNATCRLWARVTSSDFRVLERPRVTVGRRVQQEQLVAGVDLLAVELVVVGRRAAHVQHRRDPADELLDRRGGQELRICRSSSRRCSGCSASSRIIEPMTVRCRLGAAVENEDRLVEHVLGVPAFGVGPQRDQVVAWVVRRSSIRGNRDLRPLLHDRHDPGMRDVRRTARRGLAGEHHRPAPTSNGLAPTSPAGSRADSPIIIAGRRDAMASMASHSPAARRRRGSR